MKRRTLKLKFPLQFYHQFPGIFLLKKKKNADVESSPLKIEIVHLTNAEENQITELWLKPNRNIFVDLIEIDFGKLSDKINYENRYEFVRDNWSRFAAYDHIESGNILKFTFHGKLSNRKERFTTSTTYQI